VNPSLESSLALSIADVLPIVDAVVAQMSRHLPQHVSAQDLASAGKLALMEVLGDFNGSFAKDRGYVVCRVRGAIMDEMRRLDPLSRYGRAQVRRIRKAVSEFENEHNRAPTDAEVAAATGLSAVEIGKISQLATAAEALSAAGLEKDDESLRSIADPGAPSPADLAEESDSTSIVRTALMRLTSNQSAVLQGYYFRGLTLQEVADEMGLSVVRIHQIRVSAEASLRANVDLMDVWAAQRL
jgi:RNA polymerase sigma factor for flagellar operon FliA